MVTKVMITTTKAVPITAAMFSGTGKFSMIQAESSPEKAASPTMPLSTPIEVMPICTVERNWVGLSCSASAARAPASPVSAITCSRALRLAARDISDMANTPLSRISEKSRARSMTGTARHAAPEVEARRA